MPKGKGYAKGSMNPKSPKKDVSVKDAKKGFGQAEKKESKASKFRKVNEVHD